MNYLTNVTNWHLFAGSEQSDSFSEVIGIVEKMDGSTKDTWVKWKGVHNQVVIGTKDYYYKLYLNNFVEGPFYVAIREALAKVYEQLGITWNVQVHVTDKGIYTIEQRQKLQLTDNKLSFTTVLQKWGEVLIEVENQLALPSVLAQMQVNDDLPLVVDKLKLIRKCGNHYYDYALYNGHVILLDDADFFLCPIDKEGNIVNPHPVIAEVTVPYCVGTMLFAPENTDFSNGIVTEDLAHTAVNRFWLYPPLDQMPNTTEQLTSSFDKMLAASIKVVSGGTPTPSEILSLTPGFMRKELGNE